MANWWEEKTFSQPSVSTDGYDRPTADLPATPAAPRQAHDWRNLVVLVVVAILVMTVRVFDQWQGQQLDTASGRNALRQVIALEIAARSSSDAEAYAALLDPLTPEAWRQQQIEALSHLPLPVAGNEPPLIEHWDFQGDMAMVDLRFAGPPVMRETCFYRRVAGEWRRSSPAETFWGRQREADTPGIHFVYHEEDAETVREVIASLQTTYQQGNVSVLAGDRLTVEIVPELKVSYEAQRNRLTLPSPRLTPRLGTVPDSALILWRLAHPIADRLADQGDAARYRYLDSVQLFQDQLRFWPSKWQAPFPEHWETPMLDALRAARDDDLLIVPRSIDMFSTNRSGMHLAYYETMTMADYIADAYGTAMLLALDETLSQTQSWDRAIPLVLGIDIGDFERGWRNYLDARL